MASKGFADRLYNGEANLPIVGRRKMWFTIAAALVLISIGSFVFNRFHLGIEFAGGTQFVIPASIGTQQEAQSAVARAVETAGVADAADIGTVQKVGNGPDATYTVRTESLQQEEATAVKTALVADLK